MLPGNDKPIIFFDGVCGLCSTFVDFVMSIDKKAVHMFSPLQGSTAEQMLTPQERADLDTVIVIQNGHKLKKSEAIFQVLRNVGGLWGALALLSVLPSGLTDFGYETIAKFRYKLFGKKDSCRLPTPQERQRFLD